MKKLTLLTCILISTFAKANAVEDSLIANIGKKAKVIFYAENKVDFNEIAKYDLNKLFAEVRKRSEKNFSLNEEVTLREADELKNREVNTTVSTKKWLKNMNLNLFVGINNITTRINAVSWAYSKGNLPNSPNIYLKNLYFIEGKSTFMFGVGLFYDTYLKKKKSNQLSLRYGIGLDLINSQVTIKKGGYIFVAEPKVKEDTAYYHYMRTDKPSVNTLSTNLYTQIMPTISFTNAKGQKTFNFGLGVKVAVNFSNILKKHIEKSFYVEDSPYISIRNQTLQTMFIANAGYKYLNLFFQVIPHSGTVKIPVQNSIFLYEYPYNQNNLSSYTIGLRFGK